MEKKIRPYIETKLQVLHGLYGENTFQFVFAILTKMKGVSIFVSIPHCPMDYCIPAYSTVFTEQGLACNSVDFDCVGV